MRTRREGGGDRKGTGAVPAGTAPTATSTGPQLARPPLEPVPLSEVHAARGRIGRTVLRTPLVRLEGGTDRPPLWLKLECLQPIGSFKLRGAANALALADRASLARGVYTASAGNMAQGVAYGARALGIPCRVIVPEGAPRAKLEAIERLGAAHVPVPFDAWWEVLRRHGHPDEEGHFVHPVADPGVIAGNATIALEIVEDLPDVDVVVVPFGGGGLACGIAAALAALRPSARVLAAEVETAAPFAASLAAGTPTSVRRTPSFVDGIGASGVLPEMWPMASRLLDGSVVVTLEEVRAAVRDLVREARVVAEGAGAAALAACRRIAREGERVVGVVSGGNLDPEVLAEILMDGARPG